MARATSRRRPCKICRRWFLPNARLKDRQKTCGARSCQIEWHRRQCGIWNQKHREYFKANYLAKKLEQIPRWPADQRGGCCDAHLSAGALQNSRIKLALPRVDIEALITARHLIILEYIVEQIIQRFRLEMRSRVATAAGKAGGKWP